MKTSAAEVEDVPPGVVAVTSTAPDPAGEVAVIEVAESAVIVAASRPKSTAITLLRLVPVMVTEVPPAAGPVVGVIEVTVGAGGGGGGVAVGQAVELKVLPASCAVNLSPYRGRW